MKFYNQRIESICTRILYFFNTIDTYFLIVGIVSFLLVFSVGTNLPAFLISILFAVTIVKIADFYPIFLIFAIPVLIALGIALNIPIGSQIALLFINIALFFIIQFMFMGIPDSIVARDMRVAFIKMYNSLFTVAPTTVSFSMSVFFSFYLSFCMAAAVISHTAREYIWLGTAGILLLLGALIVRFMLPKNHFSKFHKLDIKPSPIFKRVVILNIDGVRKDVFDALNLPSIGRLAREGAAHLSGLETIYRALTNPAFASIFTGTTPQFHGVYNNSLGQSIKAEGLPDIVPSIAYGSMHVKHFCKEHWETRIVSLPRHSAYLCDDIMINWLKEDMLARNEIRLFIADFSAADFLAHAYGSRSEKYIHALQKIDKQIGDFIDWMRTTGMSVNTAVIVCSDHGIAAIDHSYLIADSERYVPFLICGDGIKKGFQIKRPGKIMDICCTVSYLLGIPYTRQSRGQVFSEALEDSNLELEQEELVTRFNQLKYDVEAKRYQSGHPEIYEGDVAWWDNYITQFAMRQTNQSRVLDIGCGSGFIAERFIAMGADTKEFICVDSSESMLQEAKKGLMQYPNFSFISNLNEVEGDFNLITLNSFFHHVAHPKKIAEIIDQRLAKGGIVIGSHEPNKRVFQNKLFYAAASFYKNMGGDVSIDQETVDEFNVLLSKRYPNAPKVCREEILQMVEYHSPLEQYEKGIAAEIGFVPEEFCQTYFPGYEVLILQTYSTFSHRPWLSRHKEIQSLFSAMFSLIFKEGNLFRFVLKKPQH